MNKPRNRVLWLVTPLCLFFSEDARSQVKLPSIIGDGMVLQQGMSVPVWGWDTVGQTVTVSFAGQKQSAEAGQDGRWQVKLEAMKSSARGRSLTVSGSNKVSVKNVVVGEVWICSGQSNMEWRLANTMNGKEEVANAKHSLIRLFNVPGSHRERAAPGPL
jgi:sialate O-acetylesterase